MELQQAYQTLIQDYLIRRKVNKTKREEIEKCIIEDIQNNSGIVTNLRDILYESVVTKSNYHNIDLHEEFADPFTGRLDIDVKDMNAYIDAQVLDTIANYIRETSEEKRTIDQCKFNPTQELLEDLIWGYKECLAEDIAEKGMYESMGEY